MPRTIEEGFRDFLTKLTATPAETEAAKTHRASIEACIKNNFGLNRFFRTGSFGNSTSISGYSDVDYFASIPPDNLKDSSSINLSNIREALDARFPRSGIRVSCPAIVAPFGTDASETTEIVPARLASTLKLDKETFIIYDIPDCSGGWMRSSPDAHNFYVRSTDKKLNGKVRPLIRFVKAWKYYQQVPISSFYLELSVTKFVEDMELIVYSYDLRSFFQHLSNVGLGRMQDPMAISGYISPCKTPKMLEDAKSKLDTALRRANSARDEEDKKDIKSAFFWWNLLFDEKFPNYNY